jgi:hypothetical protein
MSNPYKRLLALIPGQPIDTGEVVAVHDDGVTVELLTGAHVHARGVAAVGDHVYLRGGAIDGPAPNLPGVDIEI